MRRVRRELRGQQVRKVLLRSQTGVSSASVASPTCLFTEAPSAEPSLSPSISSVPSNLANTERPVKAPHRTSLFGQKTGANFFSKFGKGPSKGKGGGIRFNFTEPLPGPGSKGAGDCWGFDCLIGGASKGQSNGKGGASKGAGSKGIKGKSGGKGGVSKGGKAGAVTGGKAGGQASAIKGGKAGAGKAGGTESGKAGGSNSGKSGGGSNSGKAVGATWHYVSKGSKGNGYIFDTIFITDPESPMVDEPSPNQKMHERKHARQEERRKARMDRNMAIGTSKSPKTASVDTSVSDADKFTLVRDDTTDASDSNIVFISTQLINNGNDRVRRRALESGEEN